MQLNKIQFNEWNAKSILVAKLICFLEKRSLSAAFKGENKNLLRMETPLLHTQSGD